MMFLIAGTRVHRFYGQDVVRERFRHRYELNNAYKTILEEAGLVFCGMTPDRRIMQILDYPTHPFFIATQFHPGALAPAPSTSIVPRFVRAAKRHLAS